MKIGYRSVIKRELLSTKITVDKFHVIAYTNKHLDEAREIIVGNGCHVRKILFKDTEN